MHKVTASDFVFRGQFVVSAYVIAFALVQCDNDAGCVHLTRPKVRARRHQRRGTQWRKSTRAVGCGWDPCAAACVTSRVELLHRLPLRPEPVLFAAGHTRGRQVIAAVACASDTASYPRRSAFTRSVLRERPLFAHVASLPADLIGY